MKTKICGYHFDTSEPAGLEAWNELRARLKDHPHCMESHGGKFHYQSWMPRDGLEIELETAHLFNNQWNTAPIAGVSKTGCRVFDWALDYMPHRNPNIKQGHYLEQTDEMREARRNTSSCGYCGRQEPAAKGYAFCPHCLDSEYLKASELHLTRMQSVDDRSDRAKLSDAERAHLLPLYKDAQLHGSSARGAARIAKKRADVIAKCDKETRHAKIECDGFLWMMDRGINTDNLIFYSHTERFCFGWRQPVDEDLLSAVLDVVSEFPFAYDIKTADGHTLSGD
jgi:hypothetical protein